MTAKMKPIEEMTREDLADIKMIVFDVDGVLVHRGTKIKQEGNITTLETKVIEQEEIEQIKKLHQKGFLMNISSGRGLYMLQEMFREVLPFINLTYENGSATWHAGRIWQHINSFNELKDIFPKLKAVKDERIKGFEPKEFIITIHCTEEVKEIENIVAAEPSLYTVWNGEAYDIGVKDKQTKALGLRQAMKIFKLKKRNVIAMGDNYNDLDLLKKSGTPITADKTRVRGKFFVPLLGPHLPANVVMSRILSLLD